MGLNDELRSVDNSVKYFCSDNFNDVPNDGGIYAWFYPIKIRQASKIEDLIEEIEKIYNFNKIGTTKDEAEKCYGYVNGEPAADLKLGWKKFTMKKQIESVQGKGFVKKFKKLQDDSIRATSETIDGKKKDYDKLKRLTFISSFFSPPLYLGKSKNLNQRCQEHINGGTDFAVRYKKYAKENDVYYDEVQVLTLGCIPINKGDVEGNYGDFLDIYEKIVMNILKPPFSIK